ncbi:hypothetical protein EEL31_21865 [Brevibacillus laterosporus]|uniref:Uncharacterized protein n=1 Tax=Brevibacillus laterosporus TaxID=1465 RepID=A0A518V665_BRELA|nr:hypothetical protein EEL30_09415 [Brevibacillus laterosporus]TPG70828.1 hypothetical protein EEL31_21865 [Brevibacillus laterosporus]
MNSFHFFEKRELLFPSINTIIFLCRWAVFLEMTDDFSEGEPAILSKGCFVLLTVYALKRFMLR